MAAQEQALLKLEIQVADAKKNLDAIRVGAAADETLRSGVNISRRGSELLAEEVAKVGSLEKSVIQDAINNHLPSVINRARQADVLVSVQVAKRPEVIAAAEKVAQLEGQALLAKNALAKLNKINLGIKFIRVVGTAIVVYDIYNRVVIYNYLRRDPGISPLYRIAATNAPAVLSWVSGEVGGSTSEEKVEDYLPKKDRTGRTVGDTDGHDADKDL